MFTLLLILVLFVGGAKLWTRQEQMNLILGMLETSFSAN